MKIAALATAALLAIVGTPGCDKPAMPPKAREADLVTNGQEALREAEERAERLEDAAARIELEQRRLPPKARVTEIEEEDAALAAAAEIRQQGQNEAATDDAAAVEIENRSGSGLEP